MALAARQTTPKPDEWLSVAAAAELTGESVRTWRRRARSWARARLAELRAGEGKPIWYVHRTVDARLSRYPTGSVRDERTTRTLVARHPQNLVDRGLKRNHWLQRWRKECCEATESVAAKRVVAEARRLEPDLKISERSLRRWNRQYSRLGTDGAIAGVAGLVDRYGATDDTAPTRSPEAVEFFNDLYRTENKVSVAACHEVTVYEARRRGWRWPASYRATAAWLERSDDRSQTFLLRNGKRAWAHEYLPHLQVDYSTIQPGFFYQGDHTPLDFWCSYKDRIIRAWLTTFQDMRSRCIVGWHIGPTPHQDAILSTLRMAFRDWAIPSVMRIDNGKDFTSRAVTGFTKRERDRLRRFHGGEWKQIARRSEHLVDCDDPRWLGVSGELEIDVIYAIPYSPWSKGTTERFYGTAQGRFSKLQPTYCGNSPQTRPECVEQLKCDPEAVPTLQAVRRDFAAWLDIYHHTAHGGLNDDTPLSVWQRATHLRKALADELAFLMDIRGLYTVSANGVRVTVGSGPISYGAKSAALKRWVGRKVLIGVDAADVSRAWAYTPDRERRQLIAGLEPNEYIEPYTCADDAREAIADKKREQSVMHKAARASASRTKSMCRRMNEHNRLRRGELLATGTDDKHRQPRIVPVNTGFEGISKTSRKSFEPESNRPVDSGEIEDLFEGDEKLGPVDDGDDDGMEDLFVGDVDDGEPDDNGLDDLL